MCRNLYHIFFSFQASVAVQLKKIYGGLNGKVVYIDTRNGFSPLRVIGKNIIKHLIILRK